MTRKVEIELPKTLLSTSPSQACEEVPSELESRLDALLLKVAHVPPVDIHAMETVRKAPLEGVLPASTDLPPVGQVVDGRYRIEGRIGEGGMGVVLAARNVRTGREVALKYMLRDGRGSSYELRASVSRFVREAQAVGRVRDPHVVDIYDVGGDPDAPYLVMERLHGQSLRQKMREGPLSEAQLLKVAKEAARGVAAAHGQGIVHRDLKPDNLFLARDAGGSVVTKVLDFGVSRITDAAPQLITLTRAGTLVGTPAYMPPEQLCAEGDVDTRADVYALGAIMYESLSGTRPFPGRTLHEVIMRMASGHATSLAKVAPHVSPWLCSVVMKCLARDPAQRFRDAHELLLALEAEAKVAVGPTVLERVRARPLWALLGLVFLGLTVWSAQVERWPSLGAERTGLMHAEPSSGQGVDGEHRREPGGLRIAPTTLTPFERRLPTRAALSKQEPTRVGQGEASLRQARRLRVDEF